MVCADQPKRILQGTVSIDPFSLSSSKLLCFIYKLLNVPNLQCTSDHVSIVLSASTSVPTPSVFHLNNVLLKLPALKNWIIQTWNSVSNSLRHLLALSEAEEAKGYR